jgi:hypothetical protein
VLTQTGACGGQLAPRDLSAPPGHRHSVLVIRLALNWYLDGHLSLRGVATVLLSLISVLGSLLPLSLPYHQTVRTWLLRCGLFLLRRVVPPRDDWVWIIDCTIRIGQRKCLLVLGASLEQLQGSPDGLGHHQVVVLDLWVTAECTGIDVDDRLQALARRVGAPRQIVFDHGSDLNKGVHLFQESHPEVIDTYDVTHKLACLVKAELESDPRWAEFVQRSTRSMSQLQQTCGAFLMPPSLRSMARYMNVDRRINWASRMLNLLEAPEQAKAAELLGMPEEQALSWLSEKLGWLKDFREEVAHYQHLVDAVRQTEVEVKDHGLGQQTAQKVWSRLAPEVLQDAGLDNFLTELRNYLQEEGSKVPLTESWLGTSDVIESLFGKYKWFGEKAPYAEVGASVLALPVLTAELTAELIDQAMRRVSVQDVRDWVAENIGPSTLSKVCAVAAAGKKSRQSASADTDSG